MNESQFRRPSAASVVTNYQKMIAEASWEVWYQLPVRVRVWISVDDLMMAGLEWAIVQGISKWDAKRGSIHTLLYLGVRRYLTNQYILKYGRTERRDERHTISLDTDLVDVVAMEKVLYNCWSVQLVLKVYEEASNLLKGEIIRWFLNRDQGRMKLDTPKFREASSEFRRLADKERLGIVECRHLMSSPKCMDGLSRSLCWVPYNLDNPMPLREL